MRTRGKEKLMVGGRGGKLKRKGVWKVEEKRTQERRERCRLCGRGKAWGGWSDNWKKKGTCDREWKPAKTNGCVERKRTGVSGMGWGEE